MKTNQKEPIQVINPRERQSYVKPDITVYEMEPEQIIAASPTSNIEDMPEEDW